MFGEIILYSRRDPNGEWAIRNRVKVEAFKDRAAALEHAKKLKVQWEIAEPETQFKID